MGILSVINRYSFLFILLLVAGAASAQYTNSIYSAYGVGDVNIRDWNAFSPMGGVGVAMKSERTLNELNPASYSGLKNNRFLLEIAAAGTSVNYITENTNQTASDFKIKRAAFGMNLFKHVGTVFGIRKYSSVGYQTIASRYIQGTTDVLTDTVRGNGGINQAFFTNSLSIGKHISLGVSTGVLFGSVNKTETVNYSATDGIVIGTNNYYNKAFLNTGFQYYFNTGKVKWTLGGTWQPAINLNDQVSSSIADLSSNILQGTVINTTGFKYPEQYSGGISMNKGGSLLSFDYIRQNWSATGYHGNEFVTTDLQNYAVGYSYTFYKNTAFGPMERASIMAGFQRELSYIIINNTQLTSMAGTFGVNVPSKNGTFNYTLGLRVGQRGEAAYPLVKENFIDFTLNVSLGSFFYIGGRKYD